MVTFISHVLLFAMCASPPHSCSCPYTTRPTRLTLSQVRLTWNWSLAMLAEIDWFGAIPLSVSRPVGSPILAVAPPMRVYVGIP